MFLDAVPSQYSGLKVSHSVTTTFNLGLSLSCYPNIKMLLSSKASGHDWHSVALGLKVSHEVSNQCSIYVSSLSYYPNMLLSISKFYYP